MPSPFKFSRPDKPFLSPLGGAPSLPPAAAPIAVMVAGGLALIVAFGALFGRQAGEEPQPAPAAIEEQAGGEQAAAPQPEAAPVEEEEEAAETAVPEPEPPVLEPDSARTAAIPPALPGAGAFVPDVPVAETEEEIAVLEAIQRREVEEDLGAQAGEAMAATAPEEPAAPADAMRAATATRWVNMRAGPSDDAEVLVVVPALAKIEAEEDCDWCAVAYEGRSGYIYKTFISYE